MTSIFSAGNKRRGNVSDILNNDQDREILYQKIVELLIAAGYFRARIATLDPFDKILGGISWTLIGSFYDFDIDFKDEMNLAEKIKVSDKITTALYSVNCPYNLSTVQLQGLDLPIIFQVLQWLVKKLLETRDERNEINRKNAQNYYKTKFVQSRSSEEKLKKLNKLKLSNDNDNDHDHENDHQKEIENMSFTKYNYISTGRLFRPTQNSNFAYNDPLRVYFTLIEHGMNKDLSFQRTLIDLLKKRNLINFTTNETGALARKSTVTSMGTSIGNETSTSTNLTNEETKKLEELISTTVIEVSNQKMSYLRVNTSVMEEIFSENIESIISEIEKFENLKGDENIDRIKLFVKEKERLDNIKNNMMSQIKDYEIELENMSSRFKKSSEEKGIANEEIVKLNKTLEENKNNFEKLNLKIKSAKVSEEKMKLVGEKIKQREDLKLSITKFKKDCLEEKKSYDYKLENLERKIKKMNDSDNTQVFEEIDKNYQNEYEKMVIKKKDLFEQNKIINLLTRKIQVFPSKLELIQYQKRFGELYDQINNVSEKSRKILNEINSSDEVIKLLNQKLEMFVQLREAYKNSKSKKDKENFKVTLNNILDSISESLTKNGDRLKNLSKNMEENQSKLNGLQTYENKYMKLIKEYNKEYNKFNRF